MLLSSSDGRLQCAEFDETLWCVPAFFTETRTWAQEQVGNEHDRAAVEVDRLAWHYGWTLR